MHPKEAKAWLETHPKKTLVQHLEALEAEAAEAAEREALEEQAGKPPARTSNAAQGVTQGPGGLGWEAVSQADVAALPGGLAERVSADHASILDAMRALNQGSDAPAAAAGTTPSAAQAQAAATSQQQASAGGVGGVQWR